MADSGFLKGYYKNKFVLVPLKGTSKSEISECKKYLEIYGDKDVKGVLDPKPISHSDLKKFCEINNFPLYWIKDKDDDPCKEDIHGKALHKVVEFFLHSTPPNTEKTYRRAIDTLGDMYRFIDFNQTADTFLLMESKLKNDILKIYPKGNQKICWGFVRALLKFIKNYGNEKKIDKGKYRNTRRTNIKKRPLIQSEYELFIRELRKINQRDALIAEILWYMNNELLEVGRHITLESVLRVNTDDIRLDSNIVDFWRYNNAKTILTGICMPDDLFNKILELAEDKISFIFCKKDGGPLKPEQVLKSFKQAGIRAKIERTICLRPTTKIAEPKS